MTLRDDEEEPPTGTLANASAVEDDLQMNQDDTKNPDSSDRFDSQDTEENQKGDEDGEISRGPWYKFSNVRKAEGYNFLGLGRGALVMSNIFLATAFIFLASEEAGCLTESGDEVLDDCDEKVYGSSPAALIANIAVISGVLSALFMPMAGAMIDYTSHRRLVGIGSALFMIAVQVAQIGTNSKTWFPMAILQAVSGFLYQVQVMACYAYLPEISREVGESKMTGFSSIFTCCQFSSQVSFLLIVIIVALAVGLDDVQTAQVSQAINTVWSGFFLYLGWRILPSAPASHTLEEGKKLVFEGFAQVFRTIQKINRDYSTGLRWFFLAIVFAEAGVNAFTTLSVVYLNDHIGLSGAEIGIFFVVTLLSSLPGTYLSSKITGYLNPNSSLQLCLSILIFVTVGGAILLDNTPKMVSFAWAVAVGILLGWFYPAENVFFSMILPKGQEAEMSGFFVYSTQILGWLPPLIFSLLVDADVSQTYGVMVVAVFFLVAIVMASRAAPWSEIVTTPTTLNVSLPPS